MAKPLAPSTAAISDEAWADIVTKIDGLAAMIYRDMFERGFHDKATIVDVNTPEILALARLALVGTELSEAAEEVRSGRPFGSVRYENKDGLTSFVQGGEFQKPVGFTVELADAVIRIFDMAGFYALDLGRAIKEKMAYNRSRPYKHGKVA